MKIKLLAIGLLLSLGSYVVSARAGEKVFSKKYLFGVTKASGGTTKVSPSAKYSNAKGFGLTTFGAVTTNAKGATTSYIASEKPFYFSVQLPEGHYRVVLTLGGNDKGSSTTLKAESRRLMFENLKTEPGKTVTKTIIVDVRSPQINDTLKIKLKPRELKYLNWDDKLTLEFTGENPCISAIEIQKADELPTIFLAGNSTVVDQENEPYASWGQMLPCFLKPNVVVANYAESGETLLSFKRENRLAKILSQMKPGDYLFIEFAHNDQKPGVNHLDAATTYRTELKYYIEQARKKGGIPVLVTSTNRRQFDENVKVINTLEKYPDAMRQVAFMEKVKLIDLFAYSKELYEALGIDNSKKAFVHYPANSFPGQKEALADNTHFNPYGAYELAKCVIKNIVENGLPLKVFVTDDWKTYDPNYPDSFDNFHWYVSPAIDSTTPDGN